MEGLSYAEVQELARVFYEGRQARSLLTSAGLSFAVMPPIGSTAETFWVEVDRLLRHGAFPDGRRRILETAAANFPANEIFIRGAANTVAVDTSPIADRSEPRWVERGEPSTAGAGRQDSSGPQGSHGNPPAGSQPGTARTPPGASADVAEYVPRVGQRAIVVCLDAVGYSNHPDWAQLEMHAGQRSLVDKVIERVDISLALLWTWDRGDGFLLGISPTGVRETIGAEFVRELVLALRAYNRTRNELGRLRLRVSLDEGHVISDGASWAGDAIVRAARLVDSAPLRAALTEHQDADLALIVSDDLFESTFSTDFSWPRRDSFGSVDVNAAKFSGRGWLAVPEGAEDHLGRRAPHVSEGRRRQPVAESAGTTEAGAHKWDFLVSAAEHDESWASWIAWQLEERGYRAHLETWDVAAGAVIAEALDDAIRHAQRTIVVLSPSYLQSSMVRAAWQRAWARDPAGVRRLLIPVRVAPCDPDGLLRGIRYIDLVGLDERRSNAYLLEQIERSVVGRYRPTEAPRFPGSWE